MDKYNLDDFTKGWFLGNFSPTLLDTKDFEIAIKRYEPGDYEPKHYHKLADEITVVVVGVVSMNDEIYHEGDIVHIAKEEATDFRAITKSVTCVVKVPSAIGDKYDCTIQP